MTAYSRLAYGRFQRALRLHSPLRDESHKREIVFPYIAKAAVDDLLALIAGDTLDYDWLLADPMGRIIHCEQCFQVPGVDEAIAYELQNDGLRDGQYWAEFYPKRALLCSRCQRRQKALGRLIRMRGWKLLGEYT